MPGAQLSVLMVQLGGRRPLGVERSAGARAWGDLGDVLSRGWRGARRCRPPPGARFGDQLDRTRPRDGPAPHALTVGAASNVVHEAAAEYSTS